MKELDLMNLLLEEAGSILIDKKEEIMNQAIDILGIYMIPRTDNIYRMGLDTKKVMVRLAM